MTWYLVNVTVHLLAAMFWLGGMFFLAAVGAPILRRVEPAALRATLFERLGRQFRTLGWIAIAVLLVTGVVNLRFRGILHGDLLLDPAFWGTRYGVTLAAKLGLVAAMLMLQAVHDFRLGPAASRAEPGSPVALRLRRRSAWVARGSAVLGLGTVVAAVLLVRGG